MSDLLKQTIKKMCISFAASSFAGLAVNLIIDATVNAGGKEGFISMSPEFCALFPTPAIAAYVNLVLYGVIGAAFAGMTFVFELTRIGILIQSILYFIVTAGVCVGITVLVWQLHHHPQAMISTLAGYGVTYIIMGFVMYRRLKQDVEEINMELTA